MSRSTTTTATTTTMMVPPHHEDETWDKASPESVVNDDEELGLDALAGLVVEIEGNIGSGKSTLSRHIEELLAENAVQNCRYTTPNVQLCAESSNPSFLAAFYQDTRRFSFAFQMYMLSTRRYQLEEGRRMADSGAGHLVLLDRGAVGDTLFAWVGHQRGDMRADEFQLYRDVCRETLPRTLSDHVDMLVYLDVDVAECHRRVTQLRCHEAEDGIPLEYLDQLDRAYFLLMVDWMSGGQAGHFDLNMGPCPPVVVVQWDEYGNVGSVVHEMVRLVRGRRASPTVKFAAAWPPPSAAAITESVMGGGSGGYSYPPLRVETTDDVMRAFVAMQSGEFRTAAATTTTTAPVTRPPPPTTVHMVWSDALTHVSAYRRLFFYYLSREMNVVLVRVVVE